MTAPTLTIAHGLSPEAAQAAGDLTQAIRDLAGELRQTRGAIDAVLELATRSSKQNTSVGEAVQVAPVPDRPREAETEIGPQPASEPPTLADLPSDPATPAPPVATLSAGWLADAKPRPAAPKPAPRAEHVPIWSDARKDVLRREYPRGTSIAHIFAELVSLPGPAPSRNVIAVIANKMGLKRPGDAAPAVRALPSTEPEVTNFATIAAWSGARGIVFDGSNIDAVNKKRAALGFGPFVLERAAVGRRGQA